MRAIAFRASIQIMFVRINSNYTHIVYRIETQTNIDIQCAQFCAILRQYIYLLYHSVSAAQSRFFTSKCALSRRVVVVVARNA